MPPQSRLREQVSSLSSAQTVIQAAQRLGMVEGPSVIPLTVPDGAGTVETASSDTVPGIPNGDGYSQAKQALGSAP